MIFVVTDQEHGRREELATLLISVFPGSTVYQHTSLAHASGDVLHRHVDALFTSDEYDDSAELMQMLQKQRPDIPVLLLSDIEEIGYGHLPQADAEQKLRSFLLTANAERT